MFSVISAKLKALDTKMGRKGQGGADVGALIALIVLAGFGAFLVQNILNSIGIYTGLWTVLDTLWPVLAIFLLLGAVFAALIFRR